ncbi:MAG: SpoIIE family protein phosphatase [Bacteroidetes bacterium]|nr:SpoIIE family protein phosphatase [Bacteroidota bacterium]
MNYFRYTILLLLLAGFFVVRAQNHNIDSLIELVKTAPDDTNKVKMLNNIGWDISYENLEIGLDYAMQGYNLTKKLHYDRYYSSICGTVAAILADQGQYDNAIRYYHEGINKALKYHNYEDLGDLHTGMASMYQKREEFRQSLAENLAALEAFRKSSRETAIYAVYNNMGSVYEQMNKLDSALYYLNICYDYNLKKGREGKLVYNCINLADIYYAQKNLPKAMALSEQAVEIGRRLKISYVLAPALMQKAQCMAAEKKYQEAIPYFEEALSMSKTSGEIDMLKNATWHLSDSYRNISNYEKAYEYLQEYEVYKDSMFNIENNKQIRLMEAKFENGKKQKEIELLHEKTKAQELKSEKNRLFLSIAIISVVGLLIIAFVLYSRNLLRKKANAKLEIVNREIQLQKELVEHKNKEITDSIYYAKRIQKALLTSDNYIRRHLPEFFVTYMPKDIVSGDFYWAIHANSRFYIMAADCTGHGVPGAMMSMLCINFLNEIITERHITEPEAILNQLRKDVIRALNPEDSTEESQDGMDCTLIAMDLTRKHLDYSAANNSFYILRNGNIIVCRADKMPVGKSPREHEPFKQYEQTLEPGDFIIMLTDGYADQFGGTHGKKFKYKQLEELLISHAHLAPAELKALLESTITSWRGNLEQVDDITVIGIKV